MMADLQTHILVVDDEPEIADSLAEFLAKTEGYRVTVAVDGRDAFYGGETARAIVAAIVSGSPA